MSEKYYLPQQIEHYLRVLALRYEALENKLSREIIVNAKYKIEEGVGWDNWNGGCSGHDIVLIIPDTLYSKVLENKKDIESKIYNDLREISNCENEYWQSIYIDIESRDDNWRSRHEDVLIAKRKTVTNHSMKRIWGSGIVRLFLSHKVECKKQVEQLKETLKKYGISSFVAHTSIRPTKEWLNEIENALLTMDAFAAFLTDNFRDSEWTDQEVGFA
ncbi:MAG: TIR domain-containing protein, partial [Candidatus Omnitrophica bacterium]|nr:TIR domain-containing protein [Candidatus Omnitrophota bacterium]